MSMKSQTEASRALAYVVAAAHDKAFKHPDAAVRKQHMAFVELMIPVVKGWSTEIGIDVASTGVQVHGGMGYMEEAGAAQHLRDARISTIYEGTTGIQANDLIGRKMARDGGTQLPDVIGMMRKQGAELAKHDTTNTSQPSIVVLLPASTHWPRPASGLSPIIRLMCERFRRVLFLFDAL